MKITMDVECTPEEARAFLGLPDVRPMQEQLLRELQERMVANVRAMEPEAMLRTWGLASVEWRAVGQHGPAFRTGRG